MIRRWLRSLRHTPPAPRQWRLLVDGAELATLRDPLPEEMFWTSFKVLPSTSPSDPRLVDDGFWLEGRWQLVDVASGRPAPLAIASAAGLDRERHRVVLRGLDAG